MAKTRPNKKSRKREKGALHRVSDKSSSAPPMPPSELLAQAADALQQGDLTTAATLSTRALAAIDEHGLEPELTLAALILAAEIHVELGAIDAARTYFLKAVERDPNGAVPDAEGGGAEKFLWLAQLSEEGGKDSVQWFEKGAVVLRRQLQELEKVKAGQGRNGNGRVNGNAVVGGVNAADLDDELIQALVEDKQRKLATALCSVAEVYMTDLSWEADAEQMCETLVTEATMVAPEFAEPLQTLASVRISQSRFEDASAALKRSMDLWRDLDPEDEHVPDFPTRVSLARLLMEVELEEEAIEVLERLVLEEDSSVEVWYLGGWGLYILGEKQKSGEKKVEDGVTDGHKVTWISSRQWLNQSLKLFQMQEYEDERLQEHALELVAKLDNELGGPAKEGEEEWEDVEGSEEDGEDEDAEMGDS